VLSIKIVISIGGSLLTRELTPGNFKKYARAVARLKGKGHELAVVCGGGRVCREYRDVAKALGADWKMMDWVGINATHLNAHVFYAAMANSIGAKNVFYSHLKPERKMVSEARKHFGKGVFIAAGYEPGHSTDYDAALIARAVKADLLINASNVDGVYTSDPKKDPKARKIERLTHEQFLRIIGKNKQVPGEYRLFDMMAAKLVRDGKIMTVFVDGKDPKEIERAVSGSHHGTVVSG
jgi:uridylate kinase